MPGGGILCTYIAETGHQVSFVGHGLCLLGGGDYCVAGSLHAADDSVLVGSDGNAFKLYVTSLDPLVQTEGGNIYRNLVGKVLHDSAYADFAGVLIELATLLYADGVAGDDDGNLDVDGLLVIHCEEIYVQAVVGHRVPLKLVENCGEFLLAVQDKVDDVGLGSVGNSLEVLCVNGEKYVFYAEAVEVARDESLLAESLDGCFASYLSGLAVEFEMLHFFVFKMCYSSRKWTGTHCTKTKGF